MKVEFKIDWSWVLHKIRILFLLGGFWAFYTYVGEVWAFIWIAYFILNDLMEIVLELENEKDKRSDILKSMPTKRKGF